MVFNEIAITVKIVSNLFGILEICNWQILLKYHFAIVFNEIAITDPVTYRDQKLQK